VLNNTVLESDVLGLIIPLEEQRHTLVEKWVLELFLLGGNLCRLLLYLV